MDQNDNVIRERGGDVKLPELRDENRIYPNDEKYPGLPKNGNDQFDQIWKADDGTIVVVEAKSSSGTQLNERVITDSQGNLKKVKQGTPEYFDSILSEMEKRGGEERSLAREIRRKMDDDMSKNKVHYVEARGNPNGSKHEATEIALYDIRQGGK